MYTELQVLTGSNGLGPKIEHAYRVLGSQTERTCTGAAGFHELGHQCAHAYGAAGSHG